MGSCITKKDSMNKKKLLYDDFQPLRVASMYVDIGESIDKTKKITVIVDYFMNTYYGSNLDVMCLQGIRSYKTLREIITEFKSRVFDDDNIYLEYYPDIEPISEEYNWSTSDVNEVKYYDKLIITRHGILNAGTCKLSSLKNDNMFRDNLYGNTGTNVLNFNNVKNNINSINYNDLIDPTDSINSSNYNGYEHAQFVNINVDGTCISIYNIELKSDVKGIRNHKERKKQLDVLTKHINMNKTFCLNETSRTYKYGDHTLVAQYRDIHIVTGMFHINETRNDEINPEYLKMLNTLQCIDTHTWDRMFRKTKKRHYSNIRYGKDNYTLMITTPSIYAENMDNHLINNMNVSPSDKSKKIFQNYKTLITNSSIMINSVDMNYFTSYPLDTLFMILQPMIKVNERESTSYFTRKAIGNYDIKNNKTKIIKPNTVYRRKLKITEDSKILDNISNKLIDKDVYIPNIKTNKDILLRSIDININDDINETDSNIEDDDYEYYSNYDDSELVNEYSDEHAVTQLRELVK